MKSFRSATLSCSFYVSKPIETIKRKIPVALGVSHSAGLGEDIYHLALLHLLFKFTVVR